MSETARILALVRRVRRRLQLQLFLDWTTRLLVWACAAAIVPLLLYRMHAAPAAATRVAVALPLGALLAGLLVAVLRPPSTRRAAHAADRTHGLHDRLGTALELGARAGDDPDGFVRAQLRDAVCCAEEVDARRAAPIRRPPALGRLLLPCAAVLFLAAFRLPAPLPPPTALPILGRPPTTDLSPLYEIVDQLRDTARSHQDDALARLADELRRTLDAYRAGSLTREQLLAKLAEIEARAFSGRPADAGFGELRRSLEAMGHSLSASIAARDLSRALAAGDLAGAKDAARRLAERLAAQKSDPAPTLSAQERAALTAALRDAAGQRDADAGRQLGRRMSELASQRSALEEERRRLRRDAARPQDPTAQEEQRRRLDRNERELERLERDEHALDQRRRELERLQRDLEHAASAMAGGDGPQASQSMQQASDDAGQAQSEETEQQDMQAAEGQVVQMKQILVRMADGAAGAKQAERLRDYRRRSQGQSSAGGGGGSRGEESGEQAGSRHGAGGEGGSGGSADRSGNGQAFQLSDGNDGNQSAPKAYLLGQGPRSLMLSGDAPRRQPQAAPGALSSAGAPPGGEAPGTEHDPHLFDKPTDQGGAGRDVKVAGQEQDGPSRGEVIYDAAQKGFATRAYQRVFHDYTTVTEEVLEQQKVPTSYRYYVKRYFQLIEPEP